MVCHHDDEMNAQIFIRRRKNTHNQIERNDENKQITNKRTSIKSILLSLALYQMGFCCFLLLARSFARFVFRLNHFLSTSIFFASICVGLLAIARNSDKRFFMLSATPLNVIVSLLFHACTVRTVPHIRVYI